ncbi:MAG: hypothetical protein KDB01_26860 [Planctomycetaceae bacterium]|nr:hypothetical protein [Planctomycetaceae bacterium]
MLNRCAPLFGRTVADSFPLQEGGFKDLDALGSEDISDSLVLICGIE